MYIKIAAGLRPFADGSAIRAFLVAGGAYSLGSCAMGQTDGPRYRLMPPYGGVAR